MRGITPVNNTTQPSFGTDWTKSTVKFLKKVAPRLVEEDGFETAKLAITNLAAVRKRNDGLTAKIHLDETCGFKDGFLDFNVGVKNEKIPCFVYSAMANPIINGDNNAKIFEKISDIICGQDFVEISNKAINKKAEHLKKQTLKDKLKEKMYELGEMIDNIMVDYVGEYFFAVFSTTTVCEIGKKSRNVPTVLLMIEEALPLQYSKTEKKQTKALRKFIDQAFAPSKKSSNC